MSVVWHENQNDLSGLITQVIVTAGHLNTLLARLEQMGLPGEHQEMVRKTGESASGMVANLQQLNDKMQDDNRVAV